MNDFFSPLFKDAVALVTTLAAVGGMTWWLSGQFSKMRGLVYETSDKIMAKLDYHEKHDDNRFNAVHNDLWAIKLRNASADDFARGLIKDVAEIKASSHA